MNTTHLLPQRTLSPVARRLHALLRYCPGYREASDTPGRVAWVLDALFDLDPRNLPIGCMDAARELQAASLPQTLTRHLTIDHFCKIIVELGRYCAYRNVAEEEFAREQASRHRSGASRRSRSALHAVPIRPRRKERNR